MRIGIFFGGTSREREISFAGGRTVFDNLDKGLFQPVPVFVDSLGNFILLDWQYLYKGTIRDFYPPAAAYPPSRHAWQLYIENLGELTDEALNELISHVGRRVEASELPRLMDFAFLALHGPGGEDGAIQGLLEWVGIPYSGSGILPSALGIDKIAQKRLMQAVGLATPKFRVEDFNYQHAVDMLPDVVAELGLPLVVKAPRQGSSIGVSIVREANPQLFQEAADRALFVRHLYRADWEKLDESGQLAWVRQLADIREGIGMPVEVSFSRRRDGRWQDAQQVIAHPEELFDFIKWSFTELAAGATELQDELELSGVHSNDFTKTYPQQAHSYLTLQSLTGETQVLVEQFVAGREFSCIVVEDERGQPLALPPTEIIKGTEVFDYRAKYLPGLARKVTPIDLPEAD
ncbi:MAG: D-alanine--D-alanine ligase, partial [Hymenobacter sp.]